MLVVVFWACPALRKLRLGQAVRCIFAFFAKKAKDAASILHATHQITNIHSDQTILFFSGLSLFSAKASEN